MPKKTADRKKLSITLVKSTIGYSEQHRQTVRALGLRKIGQTVVHTDSPVVQGMIRKVNHLVKVEVQGAE